MAVDSLSEQAVGAIWAILDRGLRAGLSASPSAPVCVEQAVSLALGEGMGDRPTCVGSPDRALLVRLNDADWSSPQARASALRRAAIMQLGTRGADRSDWAQMLAVGTVRDVLPLALDVIGLAEEAATCRAVTDLVSARAAAADAATAAATAAYAARSAAAAYAARSAAAADATAAADAATSAAAYAARSAARSASAADAAAAAYAARSAAATAAYAARSAAAADAAAAYDAAAWAASAVCAAEAAKRDAYWATTDDTPLLAAVRVAEQAYEATGSPGLELLRKLESNAIK